ncbi:MAG: bifunctional metallophosphatase/5'-nucleotidase [Desulfovibrio sp.]|nr:bifunctional metallophosphatase/5'-nucleotidase [Desulfovibrio sp.]
MNVLHPSALFARILLCLALALGSCAGKEAPFGQAKAPEGGLDLVILHVNDMHAYLAGTDKNYQACFSDRDCYGGYARVAKAIEDAKAKSDNVIALDAGDQMQGTLFYSVCRMPMMAEVNRFMPFDAATLGNHEFDEGCAKLAGYLGGLKTPLLATNLAPQKGCPLLGAKFQPWLIREVRGVKVGIIGLANEEVVEPNMACTRTTFTERRKTLETAVKALEAQGVRVVVALTHIGLGADRELARTVDGIDVIVGGHSHSYIGSSPDEKAEGPYPIVERSPSGRPVLVVTARMAARYLGELEVQFDRDGVPVGWRGQPRLLDPASPRDGKISELADAYAQKIEAYRAAQIGESEIGRPDGMMVCRTGECPSGTVTVDAFLDWGRRYGAVMAFISGGCLRARLPVGPVTRGDMLAMHPFGNTLVVKEFTGEQILQALEHGVQNDSHDGAYLLHPAGFSYEAVLSRPEGSRIVRAELAGKNGPEPIEPKRRYKVALTSYHAGGGDRFDMLKEGRTLPAPAAGDLEVVETYVSRHSPIRDIPVGRIVLRAK